MSVVDDLREFVNQRLTAAAEEIFRVYGKTIVAYEEEIDRQRRLLDVVWKPVIKLHRLELPRQHVCKEEEVLTDQQLCIQERNSSLAQEDPEPPQIKEQQEGLWTSEEREQLVLKQETDAIMLTLTCEESDHSEGHKNTTIAYEEEIDRQRRLLDVTWKPVIKLHRLELPQQHVCKEQEEEEEVLTDQQLCIQERNSSLDQEDPEPPQIKEQQEGLWTSEEREQLVLKQATDAVMLTLTCEESDHSEGQTLDSSIDETLSAVEEKTLSYSTVESSVVSEPNSDQQLLSHNSQEAESQDQKGGKPGDSGSSRDAEPQQQNQHHTSSSHTNSVCNPTMAKIQGSTHTGKKPFKCDACGKVFKYESHLRRHLVKHTGEKPYVCKTCGKRLYDSSALKRHMKIHTGERPYVCKTCRRRFGDRSTLKRHRKIHTGEKPYTCKTCGKAFRDNAVLVTHMRTHTGEKPYVCNTCGKRFYERSVLNRHRKIHTGEKPCTCKTCGKAFRDNAVLASHMRTHTGEKPYVCKTCGRRFGESVTLKRHMKIHTGEKPYTCKTCGKAFRHNFDLKSHMRTHTGEKPNVCKTRGKRLCDNSDHTDEKPYTCKICGKDFRCSSSLKSHMRIHTDKRPRRSGKLSVTVPH